MKKTSLYMDQMSIASQNHEVTTNMIGKKALTPFGDKRLDINILYR